MALNSELVADDFLQAEPEVTLRVADLGAPWVRPSDSYGVGQGVGVVVPARPGAELYESRRKSRQLVQRVWAPLRSAFLAGSRIGQPGPGAGALQVEDDYFRYKRHA